MFPLSLAEQKELDEFLRENLANGCICLSKSLIGAPVFFSGHGEVIALGVSRLKLSSTVRVHLRLGMCYVLVLMELQHICRMDTQGDKSLLDAWAEMRRKLSSHSA